VERFCSKNEKSQKPYAGGCVKKDLHTSISIFQIKREMLMFAPHVILLKEGLVDYSKLFRLN
jgi:hypothetical protein